MVITDTQEVAATLTRCVRSGCTLESRIISAERVNEYAAIQPEAAPINYCYRPPEHWPQYGAIEFKGVSLRYRSDLELVLKDVSLRFTGGEKIGIVGRYATVHTIIILYLARSSLHMLSVYATAV
jgi:ATP-binding cassette, subfamily C (CFTR/MRP), member 1